jgi:hypothetical protein
MLRGTVKGARRLVERCSSITLGLARDDLERLGDEALGGSSLWLLHRVAAGRGANLF